MRTLINTYTIEKEERRIEIVMPEQIVFSDSKNEILCKLMTTDKTSFFQNVRLQLVITSFDGEYFFSKEYKETDKKGEVIFDITKYIQIMSPNAKDYHNINYSASAPQIIPYKEFRVRIFDKGVDATSGSAIRRFIIYNGRLLRGDPFWITPVKIKWFVNYPFVFDYPNAKALTINVDGDVSDIALDSLDSAEYAMRRVNIKKLGKAYAAKRYVKIYTTEDNGGFAILDDIMLTRSSIDLGEYNKLCIEIDNTPFSSRYTYLRWLGRHGQIYHWLFEKKNYKIDIESINLSQSNSIEYNSYQRTPNRSGDIKQNKIIEKKNIVASQNVDVDQFSLLSSILESKSIYMMRDIDDVHVDGNSSSNSYWQQVYVAGNSHNVSYDVRYKGKRHQLVLELTRGEEIVSC